MAYTTHDDDEALCNQGLGICIYVTNLDRYRQILTVMRAHTIARHMFIIKDI